MKLWNILWFQKGAKLLLRWGSDTSAGSTYYKLKDQKTGEWEVEDEE